MSRTLQFIFGTLSTIFVLVIACVTLGGQMINATRGGDPYWDHGCVTGDEKTLIAGGDESASVDLSTGAILKTVPMYVETVACGASGGTAYAASEDMVRFPAGERGPADEPSARDVVGMRSDGALVHYSRDTDNKARPRAWAQVSVGAPGHAGEPLALDAKRFGEVGAAQAPVPSSFLNRLGGLMHDGRLLLGAGWQPNRSGGTVDPAAWGIFAVDPGTKSVTRLSPKLEASAALDTLLLWNLAASRDGKVVAAAFRGNEGTTRVGAWDSEHLLFTVDIANAREPTAVSFSPEADQLAVATLSDDGSQGKVTCFDVTTGQVAWATPVFEGHVYFLQHLSDGSLVFMTSKRVVSRLSREGVPRWK
jgi:outer membrane protein assembly factor BamB